MAMLDALLELIVRLIGQFLLEVVFYGLFYPVGWLMLKILTFGQYPPPTPNSHNREFVAIFPVVPILIAVTLAFS